MLMTITYNAAETPKDLPTNIATDIGYLLHKNPDKLQTFEMPYGKAHIYYPTATETTCTMALLLEIDPVTLVRGKNYQSHAFALKQYVNDRPYVTSSLLSATISRLLGTALNGTCKQKPELVNQKLPLSTTLSVIPCKGGPPLLEKLFRPLGYTIDATRHNLDTEFPQWGDGFYYTLTLDNRITLKELLNHIYVLIPVLDGEKHYWVGEEEIQKLLDKGKGWLEKHPAKDLITYRYLKRKHSLARTAIQLMSEDENNEEAESNDNSNTTGTPKTTETALEEKINLNQERLNTVFRQLKSSGAESVLDLGCGEGKLLRMLMRNKQFKQITGLDVSLRSLEYAEQKLHLDRLPEKDLKRITLIQGSLMYRDRRLENFDAAAVVEVIEHLDPPRLHAFERVLFECAKPKTVVITTPNSEYNVNFPNLP